MHQESSPVGVIIVLACLAAVIRGIYSFVVKMFRSEAKQAIRLFEEMKTWPTVDGSIVGSSLKKEIVRRSNSQLGKFVYETKALYSPDIRYTFSAGGKKYNGSRVTLVEHASYYEDSPLVSHVLTLFPVGRTVRIHYNPKNPVDCLLSLNSDMSKYREKMEYNFFTMMKGALLDPALLNVLRFMFIFPLLFETI